MHRDFKGVWIPREIYLNHDMSMMEKVLLTEIDSLDKGNGCFASNEYLAEFLNVSDSRISHMLTDLRKKKLLVDVSFDGRRRYLALTPLLKVATQGSYKQLGRVARNDIDEDDIFSNEPYIELQKPYPLTPSNTVTNTDELALSKKSAAFKEKEPEEDIEVDYNVDEDGLPIVKRQRMKTIKAEPQGKNPHAQASRFLDVYANFFQKYYGTKPVYGYRERVAVTSALKRYDIKNLAKVADWYLQGSEPKEKKVSVLSAISNHIINKYQVETGNQI